MGWTLDLLSGPLAVCRLSPDVALDGWMWTGPLASVTRTASELSVICAEAAVPEGVVREGDWRALRVRGPLDFSLTGILAGLLAPLAATGVPVFALSTYDTDVLLVRDAHLTAAVEALRAAGHTVTG